MVIHSHNAAHKREVRLSGRINKKNMKHSKLNGFHNHVTISNTLICRGGGSLPLFLLLVVSLLFFVGSSAGAQVLQVDGMVMTADPLFGLEQRLDLNGKQSALVKVMIPVEGCRFEGSTIGRVNFVSNHYRVYLEQGVKRFRIYCPGCSDALEVDMSKYFPGGVEGKRIYELKISGWPSVTRWLDSQMFTEGEEELDEDAMLQRVNQVRHLIMDGKYNDAIELCTSTLGHTRTKRHRAWLFDVMGWAYEKSGQEEQALWAFRNGVEEDSTYDQVLHNLGVSYYYAEQYENAELTFKQAIHDWERNPQLMTNPELKAVAYCFLGASQMELGRTKEAESNLLKSISMNPDNDSMPYFSLGEMYAEQGRYQEAVDMFRTGVDIAPSSSKNINAYIKLGETLLHLEDRTAEALEAFGKADSLAEEIISSSRAPDIDTPEFKDFFMIASGQQYAQMWLFRLSDNPRKKIKYFDELYKFDGILPFFTPRDYLIACEVCSYLDDYDREEVYLDAALQRFPDNPDVLFYKALSMSDDQGEEIIDIYKKILPQEYDYEPIAFDYATVYNNIAWQYCLMEKYDDALPYALRSISLNKNHDYSWETLGEIYWYTGNYEGCIDAMTRCIGISKEKYPEAYRFRGNSLIKLGKTAEGTKDLKKADKLDGK